MRSRLVATAVVGLLASGLLGIDAVAANPSSAPGVARLSGVLHLTRGTCVAGQPSGSYLSVTFGTHAIGNPRSSCAHGAVTLLSPGHDGLSTINYSRSVTRPVMFGRHALSLVSSAQDLQDAPDGPAVFALPHIYVTGSQVLADVRSVQARYSRGCWLIGAQRATGTYDARTGRLTLSWFSGQSFVRQSAGTAVHLAGIFEGAPKAVPQGNAVKLGTASFAAGTPSPLTTGTVRPREDRSASASSSADSSVVAYGSQNSPLTQVFRSPSALVAASVLIGIDALLFAAAIGRRRS